MDWKEKLDHSLTSKTERRARPGLIYALGVFGLVLIAVAGWLYFTDVSASRSKGEVAERVELAAGDLTGPVDAVKRLLNDEKVQALAARYERVRGLRFARNFGHQAALTAGVDGARGRAVVIIDGDLQDPPEVIPEMVARWREGYEVVYGQRVEREGESWFKKATAAGKPRKRARPRKVSDRKRKAKAARKAGRKKGGAKKKGGGGKKKGGGGKKGGGKK